jgi:diguanylate cyclase (GGDEF)-like protein
MLLGRLLAMPITQLTSATHQITAAMDRKTDVSIPQSRLTEVNQLAGDFRKMTDSLSQALADMAHLARQDTLTGVCNRRRIMEYLEEEFLRAKRYGGHFCVLFYDLDKFKKINDELGHNIGDEVLLEVTKMVQGLIRQTDHIGRWGGDEFLLILPQTDLETATSVAGKIGETVAASIFSSARQRMTISVGVAEFSPQDSIQQLIARVDDALYRSKRTDRKPAVSPAPEGNKDKRDDIALH